MAIVLLATELAVLVLGVVLVVRAAARNCPGGWRVLGLGGATFVASQVVRLPVLAAVGTLAPGWVTVAAVLSSGLAEETARLVALRTVARRVRGWRDGIGFGLGHAATEAVLLVGLAAVSGIVLLLVGDQVLAEAPAEQGEAIDAQIDALRGVSVLDVVAALWERVGAACLHVALTLLVLRGVLSGGRTTWRWWGAAVVAHCVVNGVVVWALLAGGTWAAEAAVTLAAVVALLVAARLRRDLPDDGLVGPLTETRG